jgi:hypothetical protein
MNTSNNNVLKGDFDRRKRDANAAQYIALKQFERQQTADARRDFLIIAISALLVASILGALLG